MTTLQELAKGPWLREPTLNPEMDPLTEDGALSEAQVLDVRFDAMRGRASVLFELRLAFQLRVGNTGLLVADGVTSLAWEAEPRDTARTAWNVAGSVARTTEGLLELGLRMLPQAHLFLRARSAAFYSGDVPGLLEIPDYGEASDAELEMKLAQWDSAFSPHRAAFFGPDPSQGQVKY